MTTDEHRAAGEGLTVGAGLVAGEDPVAEAVVDPVGPEPSGFDEFDSGSDRLGIDLRHESGGVDPGVANLDHGECEPAEPEPPVSEVGEAEPTPEPSASEEAVRPEAATVSADAPEDAAVDPAVAATADWAPDEATAEPTPPTPAAPPTEPGTILPPAAAGQPEPAAGPAESASVPDSGSVPEAPERSIAVVVQRTHEVVRFLPTFTDPADQAQAEELNIELQRLAARVDERYDLIEAAGIATADVDDDDRLMRLPTVYGLDMAGTAPDGSAAEWELALTRLLVRDTRLSVASRTDETVTVLTGRQLTDALTRLRVAGPAGPDVAPGGAAGRAWQQMLRQLASRPALAMLTLPSGSDLAIMVDSGEGSLVQAYVGGDPAPSKGRLPRYACYPPASVPGSTRHLDAEKKLFDYLATNHHEDLEQGRPSVTVVSAEALCPSCCYVALQFLADFPRVAVVTVRPAGVRPARGRRRLWSSRS